MKPSTDTVLYMTTLPIGLSPLLGRRPYCRLGSCESCRKSIGWQRSDVERMAWMFTHEPPPDVEVPSRLGHAGRIRVSAAAVRALARGQGIVRARQASGPGVCRRSLTLHCERSILTRWTCDLGRWPDE